MQPPPKQRLHRLIDELPDEQVQAAERYLHSLCRDLHPVVRAMRSAPIDDEPLTDEDRAAIREGRREIAAGHGIPNERIRRRDAAY
ncbi:MAG: hypothetical protein OXI22_13450 [Defluviicoccus sp.]|nr:hypothetical protein [Defluviicoccus sp.]MDE0384888.1 hypothetical protein [Defluviicoccus sp.]